MLTIYEANGKGLKVHDRDAPITGNCVWIDLLQPTPEEDRFVEEVLMVDIPTRAEMREIEPSNRFYQEKGAYFMTASIVYNIEAPVPLTTPVTFILAGDRLVTVRYAEPKAFPLYMQRVDKGDAPCATGAAIMMGLIEALIHRKADLIERIQDEVDRLAQAIFDLKGGSQSRPRRFDVLLKGTGKAGDITARAEESATSMNRLLALSGAGDARARRRPARAPAHQGGPPRHQLADGSHALSCRGASPFCSMPRSA